MFDANFRGVEVNTFFYSKIEMCEKDTVLYKAGFRKGDLVKTKIIGGTEDNPLARLYINDTHVDILEDDGSKNFYNTSIYYEGNINATGFINEKSRIKAINALHVFNRKKLL